MLSTNPWLRFFPANFHHRSSNQDSSPSSGTSSRHLIRWKWRRNRPGSLTRPCCWVQLQSSKRSLARERITSRPNGSTGSHSEVWSWTWVSAFFPSFFGYGRRRCGLQSGIVAFTTRGRGEHVQNKSRFCWRRVEVDSTKFIDHVSFSCSFCDLMMVSG